MHFFSHGTTMMLGEESKSAEYWKKCGDEAIANGCKGVIMMVHTIDQHNRDGSVLIIVGCSLGYQRRQSHRGRDQAEP